MTMLQEAGIIDQPLIPDFKKHNDGTLGIIDGFFQTLVYNPPNFPSFLKTKTLLKSTVWIRRNLPLS